MGCCRFIYILIPTILTVVSLVLSAIACAGALKNNSLLTNTYELRLDFSGLDASKFLSGLSSDDSTVSSIVSALDSSSHINRELGLKDVYIFGMWGYCKGNIKSGSTLESMNTDAVDFTHCSKPKAMYVFDPASVLLADMSGSSTSDASSELSSLLESLTKSDINLPSGVEKYVKVLPPICKMIFICTIIGLALLFLQMCFSLLTACSRTLSCCVFFMSVLSFISLALACAGSTGAFMYIKKEFNNAADDFGISSNLSRDYLIFFWLGLITSLLASLFWLLSVCCCSTGSMFNRRAPLPPPPQHYAEKL